jgi:hypothetical protein
MSDLHLEFDANFFPKNEEKADILMLNGDICMGALFDKTPESPYHAKALEFLDFFRFCSNEYEEVLYIPGNHEYYRGYIDTTDDIIRETLSVFPNIHFLNNQKWEKDGITFLGATLWTDMNHRDPITEQYLMSSMNDFRIVKWKHDSYGGRFRPSDAAAFHYRTTKFFDEASAGLDNVVIMSHHAPSFMSVHPKYHNDFQMNYGYYSIFDYKINDTRVVCNPRGYKNENKFFKPHQILEV